MSWGLSAYTAIGAVAALAIEAAAYAFKPHQDHFLPRPSSWDVVLDPAPDGECAPTDILHAHQDRQPGMPAPTTEEALELRAFVVDFETTNKEFFLRIAGRMVDMLPGQSRQAAFDAHLLQLAKPQTFFMDIDLLACCLMMRLDITVCLTVADEFTSLRVQLAALQVLLDQEEGPRPWPKWEASNKHVWLGLWGNHFFLLRGRPGELALASPFASPFASPSASQKTSNPGRLLNKRMFHVIVCYF
jgi:hypothetical protein